MSEMGDAVKKSNRIGLLGIIKSNFTHAQNQRNIDSLI